MLAHSCSPESLPFHLLNEIINTSLTALAMGQNRCWAMKTWCTWAQFYTLSYQRDLQCPKCLLLFCQSPVVSVKCCDERDQRDSPHAHFPVESVLPCPAQQRRGACCIDTLHTHLVSKTVRIHCHLRGTIKHIWSYSKMQFFLSFYVAWFFSTAVDKDVLFAVMIYFQVSQRIVRD